MIFLEYVESENRIDWSKYKREYLVKDLKNNYMFIKQIKKIKKIIFDNTSLNDKNHYCYTKNNDKFNRLIGVAGERGSGKSSLLTTLKFNLENEQCFENFYVLPIIDPNKLDNHLGILETILSNLYLEIEKKRSELFSPSNEFNEVSRKIVHQLGIVSKLAISKSDFKKNYSNEEILQQYHKQLLFEDDFHELFGDVWSILKGKSREKYRRGYLVILIDDIDLVGNSLVYSMLEDIKRVLTYNTTTIVTYRHIQLLNSIYDSKIKENLNLFDQKIIDIDEIQIQTSTYIEKMFHQNQIIKMPLKEEILDLQLKELFSKDEFESLIEKGFELNNSIIKNIYSAIKKRTLIDIYSIDINERTLYESGFTLRGVVQFFEFLYEDLEVIKSNSPNKYLIKNLENFKSYFKSVAEQTLDFEEKKIIEKWDLVDAHSKNYIVYKELYFALFGSKGDKLFINKSMEFNVSNLLTINKVEPYNVSLGDVIEILNVFKDSIDYDLPKYHFIYILKIFYSIELLSSLITEIYKFEDGCYKLKNNFVNRDLNFYFENENNENIKMNMYWSTKYYQITRYKIIPESITWFSKSTNQLNLLYPKINDYSKEINTSIDEINNENFSNSLEISGEKKKIEELSRNEKLKFLDKILYTSVALGGGIQISRFKNDNLKLNSRSIFEKDPHRFRYRHYFLFRFSSLSKFDESDKTLVDEITSIKEGVRYPFDPYSYLVKESYLADAIEHFNYLFYSLFDIDIILTKNHDNKNNRPYSDLLKSMNKIVANVLPSKYNLARFSGNKKINSKIELFNENEINFLVNIKEKDERKLSELELIILGYSNNLSGYSIERKNNLIKYAIEQIELNSTVARRYRSQLKMIIDTRDKPTSKFTIKEIEAIKDIIDYIQLKLNDIRNSNIRLSED